jgi:lipopolysaccharide O-acetyltransferase
LISKLTASILVFLPRLRTRIFTGLISRLFAECGKGSRIAPPFRFANLHQVRLGERVFVNPDCWIHVVGGLGDDRSVKLDIGAYSGIGMGATIAAAKSIVLGDHVLLARNVYISDHHHAYEDISRPIMYQGIGGVAPVSIEAHTWLGQNVVVLPGSTIGRHCIIGANSVVKGPIPDYSVAVGAPARVVKRFNPATSEWERPAGDSAGTVR